MRADGATEADHLASGADQLAKLGKAIKPKPDDPSAPELPDQLAYLWDWFRGIEMAVTRDECGGAQVTWGEVRSWSHLMGVPLEPWETRTLVMLGRMAQTVAAKAFTERVNAKR